MSDKWEERIVPPEYDDRGRNNYRRDRSRVIHSAFFRRLQGKTQVLGLGESDFYRTRLTHSLEVAQIAGGITEHLSKKPCIERYAEWIPDQNLIETIGLAHDIGHPPFGHGGEVALNYMMHDKGGFEGNAQTLRICTKLGEHSDKNGLNLTRRALLGLIKYPATYAKVVNQQVYTNEKAPLNIDSYKPPKCIFDCDESEFTWVISPFPDDIEKFISIQTFEGKHGSTMYKSLDATIMELADDIAYGVHDLEDAFALNLVDERQWRVDVEEVIKRADNNHELANEMDQITANLFSRTNKIRKKSISRLVNYFITSCTIEERKMFKDNLLELKATMASDAHQQLKIFQDFVYTNVIRSPEVQTLEYKGQQMIIKLFEAISENPSRLLPKKYYTIYEQQGKSPRVICDYLAGTTDEYATRLYHKIFTPSNGSIFDRL